MSTTTLNFTFTVGAVLTDATSVVLRDPSAAFGVRRTDTLAAVVSAGAAMSRSSVGAYAYSFTDPAPGLSYHYWVEAVHGGNTYYFEKQTPRPAGFSYLSTAAADALAATTPGLATWAAADASAKSEALEQASSDVDAGMAYQGRKYDAAQALRFPRVAYESHGSGIGRGGAGFPASGDVVWDWDPATDAAVPPRDVLLAVLHQADAILAGAREPRLSAQHDGVVYDLTGTVAESYKRTTGPGVTSGLCRRSWMLVRRYRVKGGRVL